MANSFERDVFVNLKSVLAAGLTWAATVDFEQVRLATSDFRDQELPAVQFWFDEEALNTGTQRGHLMADLRITIEIVMKSTAAAPLTQVDLLDRLRDVRELLGQNLRLNVQGQMVQVTPIRAARDFVTQTPFMVGQLSISALGQVPYGSC